MSSMTTDSVHVERDVHNLALRDRVFAVIVDSPPGAGKTTLCKSVAAVGAEHYRERIVYVVPRNQQAYDFIAQFAYEYRKVPLQVLHSAQTPPPAAILGIPGVRFVTKAQDLLRTPSVTVVNVAKLADSSLSLAEGFFDLAIYDEAYQTTWAELAPAFSLAGRHLFVGDPGQLFPISKTDTSLFEAARSRVHWSAPREIRRAFPDVPYLQLPLTRRLPQDTVDLIQPSFYPQLPFQSAVPADLARVCFGARGLGGAVDNALDLIDGGASLVAIALPPRVLGDLVDPELSVLAATVIERMIARGVYQIVDGKRVPIGPDDFGYIDEHVASGDETRRRLHERGLSACFADTPEIWQGAQRRVSVVKHPLSGMPRLDTFSLEPGRFCVMTSRHRNACIIVTRDGVGAVLDNHTHDAGERPAGAEDHNWRGWQAHRTLWHELDRRGRILRA